MRVAQCTPGPGEEEEAGALTCDLAAVDGLGEGLGEAAVVVVVEVAEEVRLHPRHRAVVKGVHGERSA